jgi:NAD(P)-dependent dehydrogenase (short-subunit alcohol dehydrogenase family)
MTHGSAYSASAWGIIGLVKSTPLELAAHHITVNAVIPGWIETALTRHEERYAEVLEGGGRVPVGKAAEDEEARKILIAKIPLALSWIPAEDVAPVVVFRASDAARMVTGATDNLTGGDSAHNAA